MSDDTNGPSNLVSGEVNNTTLVMGITTSGKSSLIATMAEYAWKTYGRTTFLYTCDGGGYPTRIQALIKLGIIKVWRLRTRSGGDDSLALETTIKASKGWWPARIEALTGVTEPNVTLVPPSVSVFNVINQAGEVVKTVRTPGEIGADPTLKLKQVWKPNKGFESRGVVVFEGLTSMSRWWEDDLASRQGRLELQGEKGAIGGVVVSGTEKIGGGNRAHVGFSQRRAHSVVHNAQGIPNLVLPPVFTSLTDEGMDEGLRIIGPKLSGRAVIDEAPQWFGNVVETRMVRDEQGLRRYQLHVSEWIEDEGRRHLCKNRAEPGLMPEVFTDPAPVMAKNAAGEDVLTYPHAFSEFNLGIFFQRLEGALAQTLSVMTADPGFANAPGMTVESPEYGDVPAPTGVVGVAGARPAPPPGAVIAPPPTLPATAVVAAPSPVVAAGPSGTSPVPGTGAPSPVPARAPAATPVQAVPTPGGPTLAEALIPTLPPAAIPPPLPTGTKTVAAPAPTSRTAGAPAAPAPTGGTGVATPKPAAAPTMRTVPPPPAGAKSPARAPAVPPTPTT